MSNETPQPNVEALQKEIKSIGEEMHGRRLLTLIARSAGDGLAMIAAAEFTMAQASKTSGLLLNGDKTDKKTAMMNAAKQQLQIGSQSIQVAKDAMRELLSLEEDGGGGGGRGQAHSPDGPKPPLRMAGLAGTNGSRH